MSAEGNLYISDKAEYDISVTKMQEGHWISHLPAVNIQYFQNASVLSKYLHGAKPICLILQYKSWVNELEKLIY